MSRLEHLPGSDKSASALAELRARFAHFVSLLESNQRALETLSDMEEKARGDYIFDSAYIHHSLQSLEVELETIVAALVALGGPQYAGLKGRLDQIRAEIVPLLGSPAAPEDRLTIPLEEVRKERAPSVGSKSAQLGELKGRLGLSVPDGFAVSAWAYERFLAANGLRKRVEARLCALDIRCRDDLVQASSDVQSSLLAATIPDDLAAAIERSAHEVALRAGGSPRFAMRSSAIGEDGSLSFAGQYASYLNLAAGELADAYRRVVASKFTPQAIYYLLSHSMLESDAPMAVCCLAMVDARSAGVLYSRNPVAPADPSAVIHAVWGLGKLLVDGSLTPDLYRLDRETFALRERSIADKRRRLRPCPGGGVASEPVPEAERLQPALSDAEAAALVKLGLRLEAHYGAPQDVEWAIDQAGRCVLLQSRPLRIVEGDPAPAPATEGLRVLLEGGSTACPGAGAGPVFQARTLSDLALLVPGAVVVARDPIPGLVTVMDRVSAIVTCVGGVASHLATLSREYGVPTLVGLDGACALEAGQPVTVDATGRRLYQGLHPELVTARRPSTVEAQDNPVVATLSRVLRRVAPLNLLHPADPDFTVERCRTYHDLTRFAHQKAMESMFATARDSDELRALGLKLQSGVLLSMCVLCIDQDLRGQERDRTIALEAIDSPPFAAFWRGILEEGWPVPRTPPESAGVAALAASSAAGAGTALYREDSFAIVGREYLLCSLRMGYHWATIEAIASRDAGRNSVRIQFKGGGALADRRFRRVHLLERVLRRIGFEPRCRGDFLDARSSYEPPQAVLEKLVALGRLTVMSKQLDIALSNDVVAGWYASDFLRRLGLDGGER